MREFQEVYQEFYPQVYKYVLKLCGNESIAEEITQDTFFKVLKNIHTFKGECKLSVWICQIAKNTYYTYLKKNKSFVDFPMETLPKDDYSIEMQMLNKDMTFKIHEILHNMEEPYREVFWMRTFGELSFREIGEIHEKTESWARVTYHRAKMRIKEELL